MFLLIAIVGAALCLFIFLRISFVSASPADIKVVSGPWGQRALRGKTGWKVPLIERVDKLTASMISIDAKTTDSVPTNDFINVHVDAVVQVRIGYETQQLLNAASSSFIHRSAAEIGTQVRDTLEGHLRAIIGQMKLTEIVTDRNALADRVQENATRDLEEMGLVIVAFSIQSVSDDRNVIANLGIDNVEQIRKNAAIAKANAERDIISASARAKNEANETQVATDMEIAKRDTDLAKRRAALKAEADTEKAKADAAYTIQTQIQRRDIERETAQADIVKQEQEALVKEREVKVTRNALEATVNAKADADRYAAEQAANAKLYSRQREAEAEAFEQVKRAEATKQAMLAEAEGLRAKGEAEAAAKAAILTAEAEGLEKKAEAMAKMNQAAVLEMYFKALPDVAAAIASPLANVDSITMYGEGNSAKMVADITNSLSQVNAGLGETMGLDLRQMLGALVGAKVVAPTVEQAVADGVDKGLNS